MCRLCWLVIWNIVVVMLLLVVKIVVGGGFRLSSVLVVIMLDLNENLLFIISVGL